MLNKLKTKKFWIIVIRDLSILFIIFYVINLYQTRNTPTITPLLNQSLLSGQSINLKDMVKQSPVLIYFWGSWCPMCRITSPIVTDLSINYQVLAIALSSGNKDEVETYLEEHDYKFPVINDADGLISQAWGVRVTPTIFIINTEGKISSVTTGISSSWGLRIRLWLAS